MAKELGSFIKMEINVNIIKDSTKITPIFLWLPGSKLQNYFFMPSGSNLGLILLVIG